MEIPSNILNTLKCSKCENYLAQSPVYLLNDGEAVCATCFDPERPANRNRQYENIAKLHAFPCKNEDLGCKVKVLFDEAENHKSICEYHQYLCPILGSSGCEWIGPKTGILKHCEEEHAENVKDNSTTLIHDITKSRDQNFIIRAFQVIFLLHTKICVASGKIFHAVRYMGKGDDAKNYSFNVNIKRNKQHVLMYGDVINEGCLSIQEDTSKILKINSLLDMLGGFDGTTFTITLEKALSEIELCVKCKSLITTFDNHSGGGWCEICMPPKRACTNMSDGCTFKDVGDKILKHKYFCEHYHGCTCIKCSKEISKGELLKHYNTEHKDVMYKVGTVFRIEYNSKPTRFISFIEGLATCEFFKSDKHFELRVLISVSSDRLHEFECSVRVVQIATGKSCTYSPNTKYDQYYDWLINITEADFNPWSYEFDVNINITKKGN